MDKTPISVFPMGNDPYVQEVFPIPNEQSKAGSSKKQKKKRKKDKKRK